MLVCLRFQKWIEVFLSLLPCRSQHASFYNFHFSCFCSNFHILYFAAVDIYAGVAASLAERKKGSQLTEFLRNIKGTIDDDDWDDVKSIFHTLLSDS